MNGMPDDVRACSRALSPRMLAQLRRRFVIVSMILSICEGCAASGSVVMRSGPVAASPHDRREMNMKKAPDLGRHGATKMRLVDPCVPKTAVGALIELLVGEFAFHDQFLSESDASAGWHGGRQYRAIDGKVKHGHVFWRFERRADATSTSTPSPMATTIESTIASSGLS